MLRNFPRLGSTAVKSISLPWSSSVVASKNFHIISTTTLNNLCLCSASRLPNKKDFDRIPENSQPTRQLSNYVMKWEKMRKRRPRPPWDESHHYPDYMHREMPNQEDSPETRKITGDVINQVNTQISERSHGRLFSIVQVAGKQFRVTPEDIIIVQGYWAPDVGDRIRLEKVLLAGSSDFTLLGRPMLPRDLVKIEATVIEKKMSHLKLNFTLIKRKNFRRLYFYKTPYTMVRINSIEFDGLVNERKEIEGQRNIIF